LPTIDYLRLFPTFQYQTKGPIPVEEFLADFSFRHLHPHLLDQSEESPPCDPLSPRAHVDDGSILYPFFFITGSVSLNPDSSHYLTPPFFLKGFKV